MQEEASKTSQKMIDLLNNTELTWQDLVVLKLRELEDALKQASDESITKQV
jgi:hypothetical protein